MKLMGMEAIYPKKNLSRRRQKDAIYPYLLKVFHPSRPHELWCVDITYIKIANGFIYLTALIDVMSRCVMGYNVGPALIRRANEYVDNCKQLPHKFTSPTAAIKRRICNIAFLYTD